MVAALQEQQKTIDGLATELAYIATASGHNGGEPTNRIGSSNRPEQNLNSSLSQNTPNPSDKATTIDMYIAPESVNRVLYMYNLSGTQIQKNEIAGTSKQTLVIEQNSLPQGIYYYSLVVDGEEIATFKMILTE